MPEPDFTQVHRPFNLLFIHQNWFVNARDALLPGLLFAAFGRSLRGIHPIFLCPKFTQSMFSTYSLARIFAATTIVSLATFGHFANNNNPGNNNPNNPNTNLPGNSTPGSVSGSRPENASISVFLTDFEGIDGFNAWTINPFGKDNCAPIGRFEVGVPQKGKYQPGPTPDGKKALVTGLAFGGNPSAGDLDEGMSSAASPEVLLPEITGSARLEFSCKYLFAHGGNIEPVDFFRVKILCEEKETTVFEMVGNAAECSPTWTDFSTVLNQFAGKNIG